MNHEFNIKLNVDAVYENVLFIFYFSQKKNVNIYKTNKTKNYRLSLMNSIDE